MSKVLETLAIEIDSVRKKELWISNDQMWAMMKNRTMAEEDAGSLSCIYKYFENFPIVDFFQIKMGVGNQLQKTKSVMKLSFGGGRHCFWG